MCLEVCGDVAYVLGSLWRCSLCVLVRLWKCSLCARKSVEMWLMYWGVCGDVAYVLGSLWRCSLLG
jgi:hypothetical protein